MGPWHNEHPTIRTAIGAAHHRGCFAILAFLLHSPPPSLTPAGALLLPYCASRRPPIAGHALRRFPARRSAGCRRCGAAPAHRQRTPD